MPSNEPWFDDPLEVDRFLDGEVTTDVRLHREADVARDGDLARRLAGRRSFLAALARAGDAERESLEGADALAARVRLALASDRPSSGRRLRLVPWAAAVAAVVLVAFGLSHLAPEADALDPDARMAWQTWAEARDGDGSAVGDRTCNPVPATSPWRFPLVEQQELTVRGCRHDAAEEEATRAVLYRPGDLVTVGYVARPQPGVEASHDIGVLRLPEVVIFDVTLGGAAYHLAVGRELVERRGSCAACHGTSRDGQANPHRFLDRRLPRDLEGP